MRFKTLAALLCAALLTGALPAGAQNPPEYYAGFFDYYCHAHPKCALAGTVAAVDRAEAEAAGKFPCPVCMDDEAQYAGVESVARYGTLVIRVPDAWMDGQPDTTLADNSASVYYGSYAGEAADSYLARALHGAAYRACLNAMTSGAPVDGIMCREPGVNAPEGALMMSRRHIGAAWYLVYRPEEAAREEMRSMGSLALSLYFDLDALTLQDDTLTPSHRLKWQDGAFLLHPQPSKNVTDFTTERDGLSLEIYREMDANICVLHWAVPDGGPNPVDPTGDFMLRIDGCWDFFNGIDIHGYRADDTLVFCGVLTDAEANALKNGAPFKITYVDGSDPDFG